MKEHCLNWLKKIIDWKGLALHLALKQTPYWVRGGLGGNETPNQSES